MKSPTQERPRRSGVRCALWLAASLAGTGALAIFLWWLPARAAAGYYIPDIRGAVSREPSAIDLIWVRPWPWDVRPPNVSVSFRVRGETFTSPADPAPVSLFAPRAVMVQASLSGDAAFQHSGHISSVRVAWRHGTAARRLQHLYAVRASDSPAMPGFSPLVTSSDATLNWQFAVMLTHVPQAVLSVAAPDPGVNGPWQAPRCLSMRTVDAVQGSPQHLRALTRASSARACRSMGGPEAIVLTRRPPTLPVMYVFQPLLRQEVQGRLETVDSGTSQVWTGVPEDAFNWWRFLPLEP